MPKPTIYTVGGTVQAGGGIYIKRQADDELLNLCRKGELAFILSSRQVGKSSLMMHASQQLEKEDIRSGIIDLSGIGVNVSQEEWYLGIMTEICKGLDLKTNIFEWWSQHSQLGAAQRLTSFFRDILLHEIDNNVVLFFDEIDSTLSIPFSDDFYVALRAVYNARATTPEFKRLSFVLVGVASPSDLISDSTRTPFNIGHRVEIKDFTIREALPLTLDLGEQAEDILKWIHEFTGGHPYLTQSVCAYLANSKEIITQETVSHTITKLFTGEQGKKDNNLQFVRDMLSRRSPDFARVLLTYKDIRTGKKVLDDERSIAIVHLKLAGLVRSEQGVLIVRNEIYSTVFNQSWIQENVPRNWTKIAIFSLGFVTFSLMAILAYDFIVSNLSSRYVDNFYRSQNATTRLESLARIFDLKGFLPSTDYDTRARELFFSLTANDQTALFKDPSPTAKSNYLVPVVRGLYVTMANVEGGQDSTPLLIVMRDSLKDVDGSLSKEIDLWLQARDTIRGQDALEKYDESIQMNNDNPATHYERAVIEIELGLYEEALADLNTTMTLAISLSTEAAEREISTPTPIPADTGITPTSTIFLPGTLEPAGIASVAAPIATGSGAAVAPLASEIPTPIGTPTIAAIPEILDPPSVLATYRSNFFSRAYIRSAVDLLIKKNISNPKFRVLLTEANYPDLASNGLIPQDINTALTITISANPTTYRAVNQQITYTYTITNTGALTLGPTQFIVRDDRNPNPMNCGTNTTTLAMNQSVTCNAIYTTSTADIGLPQFVNTVLASGGGAETIKLAQVTIFNDNFPVTFVPGNQPIRLTFPAGNPKVTLTGTINTPQMIRYVFTGASGQTMSVKLTVPSNDVGLVIYVPNRFALKPLDLTNSWTGTLNADGDHFIDLVSSVGATSKQYTLEVTLNNPAPASPLERVADINPGVRDSNVSHLQPFNGQLYFQANANDGIGAELWRFDPELRALSRVADMSAGATGSEPAFLTQFGDMLYFSANGNDGGGRELWRFNGTATGRVSDINANAGDANPMYLTVFNNALYFRATGSDGKGAELWKYDGTVLARVTDINPDAGDSSPAYMTVFNNALYFSATSTDGSGTELWKFDGTTTTRVADINPGVGNSNPAFLTVFNNALYFSANGGDNMGTELWRYDGTNPPVRAADINVGAGDSAPTYLTVFNNALYFSANGDATGFELWKFDGTTASRITDINTAGNSDPAFLTVFNNQLYFQADGNDNAGAELWKYSGQ